MARRRPKTSRDGRAGELAGLALSLAAALALFGCDGGSSPEDGGAHDGSDGADAADSHPEADGENVTGDGSVDDAAEADVEDGPRVSGEDLALVATEVTFSAERLCDLDGDGVGDNSIAELDEAGAERVVMLFDALAEAAVEDGYGPGLFFPVVVDGGESILVALSGDGTALGDELRAPYESMDGCGEPLHVYADVVVDRGSLALSAPAYPVLVGDAVATGRASITGHLSVGSAGLEAETEECLAPSIRSLGSAPGPAQARGLSLLEVLVGGGNALGMPGVSGLAPNIDVDGDGLERVLLDGDGHVAECVDGDDTVINGTDCWADDRMQDAFALTRLARYEEARFAGRFEGWMGYCPTGYPRPSIFGEEWNAWDSLQISATGFHTCLLESGAVRCWGRGADGRLGYGNTETIGDDEPACAAGFVDLGEGALSLATSGASTCAILAGRRLRCWGLLGDGTPPIGDDETPSTAGDFELGAPVQQVVVGGGGHFCALLSGGRVRCWGTGANGVLGQASTEPIPPEEAAVAPDVQIGGRVLSLAAGYWHTCALLEGGAVRCWGSAGFGQLGYGSTANVGDDETPAEAGDVDLGGRAIALVAGSVAHTCALLEGGAVRCWGYSLGGMLGYATGENVGDDETPAEAGNVDLGGPAVALAAGAGHTCAVLEGGAVRCWGMGEAGRLGYGNEAHVGDDEPPSAAGDVDVGGPAVQITAGNQHTCAVLESGAVRCWGFGGDGCLGYGTVETIGDDESPSTAGDVPIACDP